MTDDINALRARISELEALIFSSGKPISQFGTISLPRSVVEQAMNALVSSETQSHRLQYDVEVSALDALSAALEQPQNHVPDIGNMVPAGWKLVPSDATHKWVENLADRGMRISGLASAISDMLAAAPQPSTTKQSSAVDQTEPAYLLRDLAADIGVEALDLIAAIRDVGLGSYSINMMLPARVCVAMCQRFFAAPQPQSEQEPAAWIWTEWSSRKLTFDGPPAAPSVRDELTKPVWTPLYTRPQPKREPLTEEQIAEVLLDETNGRSTGIGFKTLRAFARAIERAHGIGQGAAPQPLKDEHAPGEVR